MAFEIDRIQICVSRTEWVEFSYKNKKWSRCITTVTTDDHTREETSSISPCTAEDVIVALLLNMNRDDRDILVYKYPFEIWIPVLRAYFEDGDPYPGNVLGRLVGDDELKFR